MPLLQGAPVRLLAILLVSQHGVRLYVLGSCAVRLPLTVGQVVGGVGCVSALCVRFGGPVRGPV